MALYKQIFKLRLRADAQYRIAAISGVATQVFFGFVFLSIYLGFYGSADAANGFSKQQMVNYLWLQQAFLTLIALWIRDNDLFNLIETGDIAYELCRPISIYKFWFSKLLASRIAKALLRFFPVLLVGYLLPAPYGMSLPHSLGHFALFLITLALGVTLNVILSMFIYISVFVTLSPLGSLLIFSLVGEFLAGLIIPIPLMPEGLRQVVLLLPFSKVGDLPFRLYSGNLSLLDGVMGLIFQLFWIVSLAFLGEYLMNQSLKKLVVQGG